MIKEKVVICASASLEKEILEYKKKLNNSGYNVIQYPTKIKDNFLQNYKQEFTKHYNYISKADIVLALNLKKKNIPGYIGSGVFAEMAFAIGLNKVQKKNIKVRYLNPIPEDKFPYSDELKLWQELGWIKKFNF